MTALKTAVAYAAAIGGVVAICVGAYFLYWTVSRDATDRRTDVQLASYGAQIGARDALVRKVADIEVARAREDAPAVIQALIDDACQVASRLTAEGARDLPTSAATFIASEC